jgi:hypothetical protein
MKFKRIDAFEMNFEECACKAQYKLNTSGVGEKRLYVGHDETLLDEFFDLENIESFIFLKNRDEKGISTPLSTFSIAFEISVIQTHNTHEVITQQSSLNGGESFSPLFCITVDDKKTLNPTYTIGLTLPPIVLGDRFMLSPSIFTNEKINTTTIKTGIIATFILSI